MPHADDRFHVKVRREEDNDPIGGNLRERQDEAAVIAYDPGLVPNLEARGDGRLVTTAGDDHREEGSARERHAVGLLHNGCEA